MFVPPCLKDLSHSRYSRWLVIVGNTVGYLHNPTYNKQYFGMEHLQKRKDDDPARQTHGDGAAEPEESLAIEAQVPGGLGV